MRKIVCDMCDKDITNDEVVEAIIDDCSIDFCRKCANRILMNIKHYRSAKNYAEKSSTNVEVKTKHKYAKNDSNSNSSVVQDTKASNKSTKTTMKGRSAHFTDEELEEKIADINKRYEEMCERESGYRESRKKSGRVTALDKIEAFGVEKFSRMYLTGTPSIYLEELIGVNKNDIASFVRKLGIQKTRRKEPKSSKEGD